MRINKFIAAASGLSRRAADQAIEQRRVTVDGQPATPGQIIERGSRVTLGGQDLVLPQVYTTIILHKPTGYVASRDGQGSPTIYGLLPPELHHLKPVGRLDKDSSGLLLLTDNGQLAFELTHPKFDKTKVYNIELDHALSPSDQFAIQAGIQLEDGISQLQLSGQNHTWTVNMSQGRNRQIRRTFKTLGYTVVNLHRTQFGDYELGDLPSGEFCHTI